MADNNDILKALESLQKDMATKSDLDVIKKNMATKSDLQEVKQSQAQTNTALEALAAGQKDIHDNMATKADIHRLEQKIDKVDKHIKSHESSIDNLETSTNTLNPQKN